MLTKMDAEESSFNVKSTAANKDANQIHIRNGSLAKQRMKEVEEKIWEELAGDNKAWKDHSNFEKVKKITINVVKVCCIFSFLYLFICSLELLSSSFSLISGQSTGALVNNDLITNPVVGLMAGILLTVLVQSSSTSTSIIVSMVASGMLTVHDAIPMIMGANIGTSVTNTIVAMTQVGDREQFRRAFSGATVHDMFNWMAVIVLLPVEIITGVLESLTTAIVDSFSSANGAEINFLNTITEPFTTLIMQLDEQVVECWGMGYMKDVESQIKQYCLTTTAANASTTAVPSTIPVRSSEYSTAQATLIPTTEIPDTCLIDPSVVGVPHSCSFLFYDTGMNDQTIGIILLIISLFLLCGSLIIIVKLLNSILKGAVAKVINKVINADIPHVPWLTGYIAMVVGAIMTFLVQSSSVFTSTMTPLIGMGIISVERAYPLTLGSNIGTTSTALLAAMASTGSKIYAIQIALVHLFFNIFAIMLYYPIPFTRIPIPMCKFLGNVTANYRWFAIFYLITVFFMFPASIFALSLAPTAVFWGVFGPVVLFVLSIVLINVVQNKKPSLLPRVLRDWEFLPYPLRSLEPYDKVLTSFPCCKKCRREEIEKVDSGSFSSAHNKTSSLGNSSSTSYIIGIDNPALDDI